MAPDPVQPVSPFRPYVDTVAPRSDSRPRPDSGSARSTPARALPTDLLLHGPGTTPTDTVLALVRDALEEDHPEAALKLLDPLWSAGLAREDCWFLRGQALYQLKRFGEAADVVGQGLARQPGSVALRYLLASCELSRRDGPAAEQAMRAALRLAPDEPVLLCRLAELLGRTGRAEEGGRLVRQAAAKAPDHPLVAYERQALAATLGDPTNRPTAVDRTEPYTRAGIGLSLLAAPPAPRAAELPALRWTELLRLGCVGAALVLFASGHHTAGVLLGLTTIAGPILWRDRGR